VILRVAAPGRTDSASRVIHATAEVIYQAFLDPVQLLAWLPPDGMTGHIETIDPREGGRYRLTLTYQTSGHTPGKSSAHSDVMEGLYVQLVPNSHVVQLVEFDSEDPAFAGTMKMTWALAPAGAAGTRVSMICEDVPPGISQRDHLQGLEASLRNLAELLEH
jgi:uncharacterized protein YndB with AHSA1/START domain